MLPDGFYAVSCGSDYRLIWLKTIRGRLATDIPLLGKRVLLYRTAAGWQSFAFLTNPDDSVQVFKRFEAEGAPERWTQNQLEAIRSAVAEIVLDPFKARKLYTHVVATEKRTAADAEKPAREK